ncbi:MAG: CapA family protein [Tannerellaceae bacterium]|nr:CapA family protein [Tannerellaceae bacterium]
MILVSSCCREETTLTISFTGDILLDRGVREQIEKKSVGYLLEDVAPLFLSSDAVVVNLECPVTDTVTPINKWFIFRAEPEWLPALAANGITHAGLANNHSMDQGRKGLSATYRHLQEAGITPLGYGECQPDACSPLIISRKGMEVAIFSSVLVPLENWVYLENQPGVCQATAETLAAEIQALKETKPTCFAIAFLHWGTEYQQTPTLKQRRDAYLLIDAGADAIIGHHPHVIQKEEVYKEKPIFYSLGNFIFDQNGHETQKGLLLQLTFDKKEIHYRKHPVEINRCKPYLKGKKHTFEP